jgi:hypothetical protein
MIYLISVIVMIGNVASLITDNRQLTTTFQVSLS